MGNVSARGLGTGHGEVAWEETVWDDVVRSGGTSGRSGLWLRERGGTPVGPEGKAGQGTWRSLTKGRGKIIDYLDLTPGLP